MRKKGFFVVLIMILVFAIVSISAYGGCCVYPDSCVTEMDSTKCTTYKTTACGLIDDCDVVCCCKNGDNSIDGKPFTKNKCAGAGGTPSYISDWLSPSYWGRFNFPCKAACGATNAPCTSDYLCPDNSIMAECVESAAGKFYIFKDACSQAGAAGVDTDGDGVPDSADYCPKERQLTTPQGPKELICTDAIDNDCDELTDCNDPDCCSVQSCFSNPMCIVATCGNGTKDPGEECDDSNRVSGDGCSNICKKELCGDGIVQPALGEECDFGDALQWSGCNKNGTVDECRLTGKGVPAQVYECNDGIDNDGDGCTDWPMDKDCLKEDDDEDDNMRGIDNCARCGDNILDTPNNEGFNEDCDGKDEECGTVQKDGTCTQDCTCSYQCIGDPGTPYPFAVEPVRGEFANLLKWQMHPNCNVDKMYVYGCSGLLAQCLPDRLLVVNFTTTTSQRSPNYFYEYTDNGINPFSRYCYRIDAYYTTGVVASSDVQCITTGDENCMAYKGGEFCNDNNRYRCDKFNMPEEIENCSEKSTVNPDEFVCVGPDMDGETQCLYQSDCSLCNGLFGLFAMDATAIYQGPLIIDEEEETAAKGSFYPCYSIPTCYNDTTRTTINKYQSCIGIKSCYDYTSQEACAENKCQLGGCEWVSSVKAFKEFGIGVCRPKAKELQNCSLCGMFTDEAMNTFYGDCDVEVCKLYGECYFSYGECGSKDQSSCWSYMTEDDCINSNPLLAKQSVSVNTKWDYVALENAGSKRVVFVTSGTWDGNLISAAHDELGIEVDTGLEAADALCQAEADAAGLKGMFRAWLSDTQTDMADRIEHSNIPYTLPDGTLIANNWDDLMSHDGSGYYLKNKINMDASGSTILSPPWVWTGTDENGERSMVNCNGWTSNGFEHGYYGSIDLINSQWTKNDITGSQCDSLWHLYCFQQGGKYMKVGIDNALLPTKKSNDYFGFGLCKWVEYTGIRADIPDHICIKDADNNTKGDCSYGEEFKACQIDNTPPKTTFILDGHPISEGTDGKYRLLLPKKIDLQYYTSENAKLYFCIAPEGITCYPNETSMCGLQKTFDGDGIGYYKLYYFAEDNSHNLEERKYIDVEIDAEPPEITLKTFDEKEGSLEPYNDYVLTLGNIGLGNQLTCSGRLMKGNGVPYDIGNPINFEIDTIFHREYYDLPDDKYYFEYECKDTAGNVAEGKVWINGLDGVNTNRIKNPSPNSPQKDNIITISVQIDGGAEECRYSRYTGYSPPYDTMTRFETNNTDRTEFSSQLNLAMNEYYDYAVRCKFADGSIEGNDNDRIRFSIDNVAPSLYPVTTFEAYDYDVSQTWGKDQEIRLQCRDDYFERVKKVANMDFGCKKNISYKMDVNDEYGHFGLDEDYITIKPLQIVGTGTHTIYYVANDTGNNTDDDTITIMINSDPPELDIELLPYPVGPGSAPIEGPISYGYYTVKVTSTKSLNDINLSLTTGNVVMIGRYLYNENFRKTHYFLLIIPPPEEGGLAKGPGYDGTIIATGLVRMPGSACTLDKIDETALVATEGKAVRIETADPDITIEPSLDNYEAPLGYPLKKKDGIYYTNESKLFISGTRNNVVDEVWFYVLNGDDKLADMASPQKIYSYSAGKNAPAPPAEPLNTAPISIAAPYGKKGSFTLNVAQNSKLVNDESYLTQGNQYRVIGKYIEIAGKNRESYGHYKEFYRIDWVVNLGGGVWELTLKEPLEDNLGSNDQINVYSAPYPFSLFGQYIDLESGKNTVFARPRSVSGVMPQAKEDEIFEIFTDPNPPVVISQTPKNGTTNNIYTDISIVLREGASESLVDESSIKLMLNGQEMKDIVVTNYTLGSFVYYEITYTPEEPLNDGTYVVEFKGHDNSGHGFASSLTGGPSWTFIIDTKAPSTPTLWIENGTFFNGIWYVNRSPGFELEFSDNDVVNITSIYKDHPFAVLARWKYTRDSMHNNLYDCVFEPELVPMEITTGNQLFVRDEFQLIVEAYKNLQNKQRSPKGNYYLPPLVIDDLAPRITSVSAPKRIRVDGDVLITARIPNEFHDLNATLIVVYPETGTGGPAGQMVYPVSSEYQLEQISHIGSFYDFKWHAPFVSSTDLPSGFPGANQTFTLKIADYASNRNSTNISMFVDTKVPSIDKIHVNVTPTIEQFGEYLTRYTTVVVSGDFDDDDIAKIFIIPGDYMPGMQKYENVSQSADIFGKRFLVNLKINGTINQTILNKLNIFIVDQAGYQVFLPMSVVADLEPPRVESSTMRESSMI